MSASARDVFARTNGRHWVRLNWLEPEHSPSGVPRPIENMAPRGAKRLRDVNARAPRIVGEATGDVDVGPTSGSARRPPGPVGLDTGSE
jgi:hypothetical protein